MMMFDSKLINNVLCIKINCDRLDASKVIDFKQDITEIIKSDSGNVVLDLSAVKFMDSAGLGALVSVLKILGVRKLVLCGVAGMLIDLFKLTRMDQVFTIVESQVSALNKLIQ